MKFLRFFLLCLLVHQLINSNSIYAQDPVQTVDLRGASTADGSLLRVYGSDGDGRFGVPVAGSRDCNGDGFNDIAVGYFTASPLGRSNAGEVILFLEPEVRVVPLIQQSTSSLFFVFLVIRLLRIVGARFGWMR